MWKKIPSLSEEDAREIDRSTGGKARFLIDENLGKLAEMLRELGWNAVSAQELGLTGHSDEDLFGAGWRDKRVIITNDRDFLDDRKFPFHRCHGVLIVPSPSEGIDNFANALAIALPLLKRYTRAFEHEKIIVNADGTWVIRGFSKTRGEHWKLHVKIDEHGAIWEYSDD